MNDVTSAIPRPLVDGPSAWFGPDLAARPESWIREFSAAELAEIDAAVAGVAGRDLTSVTRADFPLPRLGSALDGLRDEILNGRGFVLLRGLDVERRDIAWIAAAYWGIGTYFGHARSQNAKGHLLGHVRDMGLSSKDPNVRIYQTTERQNFHTDSCDIVTLMCLKTAREGGLSSLTSSMTVYNVMAGRAPGLAARLFRRLPTDRRGEVPPGQKPYFHTPVYSDHAGYLSAIYAPHYVRSSQRFPEAPRLTDDDLRALDLFDSLAEDPALRLDMALRPGDIQFVHNHTILHDRTAFVDWPEPERKRHLLRLWLAAPGARPLPAYYAERYGSVEIGNRGGIICEGTRLHVNLEPA